MKFLEKNLLDYLKRKEFSELHASLKKETFPKGSFISQPGRGEDQVFIVAKGRARVYLGYEDKEFNLCILSKGDIFSTHTRAFVVSLEEVQVLITDVMTFRKKMLNDKEVTKAMVGILGSMLKNSLDIIENLVFRDVKSRLIALFVTQAKREEPDEKGSIVLQLDLSVEQIAHLIGSTRQTVSTLLNDFARSGIIKRLDRGAFLISDLAALEAVDENYRV